MRHIQSANTFCQIVCVHVQLLSRCCWKMLKNILFIKIFWARAFNTEHCARKSSLCYFLSTTNRLQNLSFNYLWDFQSWFGRSLPVSITAGKGKNSLIKTGKHNCFIIHHNFWRGFHLLLKGWDKLTLQENLNKISRILKQQYEMWRHSKAVLP